MGSINLYNSAVVELNEAINKLNDFINYRNSRFVPNKTDQEIQNMLDIPNNKLKDATNKLEQIANPDANITNMSRQLIKSIDNASKIMKEQQDWLKLYFSKGKLGRKSMFYKITWLGKPLN